MTLPTYHYGMRMELNSDCQLINETFTGTTINNMLWYVHNNGVNGVTFTQDGTLRIVSDGLQQSYYKDNYIRSRQSFNGATQVLEFIVKTTPQEHAAFSCGFWSGSDLDNVIEFLSQTSTNVGIWVKIGGSTVSSQSIPLDISDWRGIKIEIAADKVEFYYKVGTKWFVLGDPVDVTVTKNWYIFFATGNNSSGNISDTEFDNVIWRRQIAACP